MRSKKPKKSVARQAIRASHWKRTPTIAKDKYDIISKAILSVLGTKGMRFGELSDQVEKRIKKFEGSVGWYTISCLRELETQGKVRRQLGPPTLYSRKR